MTLSAFEENVGHLTAMGFSRAEAEAAVRTQLRLAPVLDPHERRREDIREKAEQAAVVKLFRMHGFKVRSTSQARASKIAIGFADLFVTHKTLALGFFFETKRQVGGVISEAQKEFAEDCVRCGILWYAGDRYTAQRIIQQFNVPEI
jgi:hypothetical protein